ncbi:MAG: hypothetical protein AB2800_17740 [Candidatus Thiodiazotropha endolucinida]
MADDIPEERRKLQFFRDKVMPSVLAAIILSTAGGLVVMRDTVQQLVSDMKHFRAKCHMLESRTSDYIVMQHKVEELNKQLKECRVDIDRLERR